MPDTQITPSHWWLFRKWSAGKGSDRWLIGVVLVS
jgi:hypothetical protein